MSRDFKVWNFYSMGSQEQEAKEGWKERGRGGDDGKM